MSESLRLASMHRPMLTDAADLDRAFRDGAHDALRRAFERHGPLVFTFCRRALGPELANDVTQEVFITAWRKHRRFDPERGVLAGWLIGIARNKVLEALRRRPLHLVDDENASGSATAAPDSVGDLADRLLLADALGRLPARSQRLIEMAFREDLTHAEIADRTGLPLGTVKSDIRRGLARLRRLVEASHD